MKLKYIGPGKLHFAGVQLPQGHVHEFTKDELALSGIQVLKEQGLLIDAKVEKSEKSVPTPPEEPEEPAPEQEPEPEPEEPASEKQDKPKKKGK